MHLEVVQRLGPLQRLVRVFVVDPVAHGTQHERQAAWEAAGVVLAQVELRGIESRLDGGLAEAGLCQLLQGGLNQVLYLSSPTAQFLLCNTFTSLLCNACDENEPWICCTARKALHSDAAVSATFLFKWLSVGGQAPWDTGGPGRHGRRTRFTQQSDGEPKHVMPSRRLYNLQY